MLIPIRIEKLNSKLLRMGHLSPCCSGHPYFVFARVFLFSCFAPQSIECHFDRFSLLSLELIVNLKKSFAFNHVESLFNVNFVHGSSGSFLKTPIFPCIDFIRRFVGLSTQDKSLKYSIITKGSDFQQRPLKDNFYKSGTSLRKRHTCAPFQQSKNFTEK